MLVSGGSPGASRRCGDLSEGASDENAMAPEAFEGPLAGPDAVRSFPRQRATCADDRRGDAPSPGILSRTTGIRNGIDHNEPRQTWRYR